MAYTGKLVEALYHPHNRIQYLTVLVVSQNNIEVGKLNDIEAQRLVWILSIHWTLFVHWTHDKDGTGGTTEKVV